MANEKKQKPTKSEFDAPVYGYVEKIPEGHVAKKGKDGIVRYVPVKKAKK